MSHLPRRGGRAGSPPPTPDGSRGRGSRGTGRRVHAVRVPDGRGRPGARGTPGPRFGVLGGSCDPDRVTALARAGVRLVEVGVDWGRFEPAPQRFDQGYIDDLRVRLARCADAGLGVVLTPGFQYAPAWVLDLPDGAYLNQYGKASPAHVPNYAFSATVRGAAQRYLDRFAAEFPLDRFAAVRVGTSEAGELGYPSRQFGTKGNGFWAFDDAALTGNGLPVGAEPNPMPGWLPGARTWQGRPVDTAAVRSWFDWYADSVARTVLWQIGLLRDRGYPRSGPHAAGRARGPARRPRRRDRSGAGRHGRLRRESGAGSVLPRPAADHRRCDRHGQRSRRRDRGRRRDGRGRPQAGPAAGQLPGDGHLAAAAGGSVRRHLVGDALDRRQRPCSRPACRR